MTGSKLPYPERKRASTSIGFLREFGEPTNAGGGNREVVIGLVEVGRRSAGTAPQKKSPDFDLKDQDEERTT